MPRRKLKKFKELPGRIEQLRTAAGMSKRALATRAGLSPAAVLRIERGEYLPNLGTLQDLADALGTTPVDLLGGADTGRRFRPRVERLAHFLEGQPDEVVEAIEKCVRLLIAVLRNGRS